MPEQSLTRIGFSQTGLRCPADQDLYPQNTDTAVAYWSAPRPFYNGVNIAVSSSASSGAQFTIGSTTVSYSASASGPLGSISARCTFVITVHGLHSLFSLSDARSLRQRALSCCARRVLVLGRPLQLGPVCVQPAAGWQHLLVRRVLGRHVHQ